ncbi:MAG: hypothetical protein K6F96_03585 [Bacteroidales bacterium]|nr:hypothetical protein [Bacteroidales bacterium]
MKLATVVVCYHPSPELLENITSYSDGSALLFIWDNTPGGSEMMKSIPLRAHWRLLNMGGENQGLAFAYNRAMEMAKKEGCTHVMTMDQDSRFEHFDRFLAAVSAVTDPSYGMFCPPLNQPDCQQNKEVPHAAQSGCVFDMQMIDRIGGFREDFFIGMVDVEMQLRASRAGYKILCVAGCNLVHHIGSERKVKVMGHQSGVSDYSPLRHYYDSRNRILMWREFPDDFSFGGKMKHFLNRMKTMLKIVLFEDAKWKKIKAIIRGTYNGLANKVKPY